MFFRVLMSLLMIVQPLAAGEWCRCMASVSASFVATASCGSSPADGACDEPTGCCPGEPGTHATVVPVKTDSCCAPPVPPSSPADAPPADGCCTTWSDCSSCETCGLLPVDESKLPVLPSQTLTLVDHLPAASLLPTGMVMEVAPPTVPSLPNLARALPPPVPPDRAQLSVWVI
jgi:hypothetical protein